MELEEPVCPPLPAMSRHHVLHLASVLPTLPSMLTKTLFVLACHADHRTGLSRPGWEAITERWGIPYSTWYRHVTQLAALGLVAQTVKGCTETGMAAEYRLLYVPALTDESPAVGLRQEAIKDPSPQRGGEPTGENACKKDPPLTAGEAAVWSEIRDLVFQQLTPQECHRLHEELADFERLDRMRRTAVRLASQGHQREVVQELTRRKKPEEPAYLGAKSIPAAMWARVAKAARARGVDMADDTPVEDFRPPAEVAAASAEALEARYPGFANLFTRTERSNDA